MLARLTRNLFSAGRFQNVLNHPFKWYALKIELNKKSFEEKEKNQDNHYY